jgi:hypothetical protein
MFFVLDNMSSMIVFGTIALVVLSTQLRVQQTTVEQTVAYVSKTQTLDFANTVEREFKLMGVGIGHRNQMIASHQAGDDGNTSSFAFRWVNAQTGQEMNIEYRAVAGDTVRAGENMVELLRIQRYENGHPRGSSPPTLTRWRVDLLNNAGSPTSITDATLIRVSFANLMAIGDAAKYSIPETHWAVTLRPHNLAL